MNRSADILKRLWSVLQESLPSTAPAGDQENAADGEAPSTGAVQAETEIKELCREFAKAVNNRDFNAIDGRAEYHLYTIDHLIRLAKEDDEQATIKFFVDNKIVSVYEDSEFLSLAISPARDRAEVVYNVRSCILSATDKYFKALNKKNSKKNRIGSGTPFRTTYTLALRIERGVWKVDAFSASAERIKMDTGF